MPTQDRLQGTLDLLIRSEMKASENNRRARVCTIPAAGRRRLDATVSSWQQFVKSMRSVLQGE